MYSVYNYNDNFFFVSVITFHLNNKWGKSEAQQQVHTDIHPSRTENSTSPIYSTKMKLEKHEKKRFYFDFHFHQPRVMSCGTNLTAVSTKTKRWYTFFCLFLILMLKKKSPNSLSLLLSLFLLYSADCKNHIFTLSSRSTMRLYKIISSAELALYICCLRAITLWYGVFFVGGWVCKVYIYLLYMYMFSEVHVDDDDDESSRPTTVK